MIVMIKVIMARWKSATEVGVKLEKLCSFRKPIYFLLGVILHVKIFRFLFLRYFNSGNLQA